MFMSHQGITMNNMNDPTEWNIKPDERGDGGSNKWNYALIVPMLSLAAYRWIWDRDYQGKIQQVKVQCERDMKAVTNELERRHQLSLIENRRKVAHLQLKLEKERHRVQQAMASLREKEWETEAMDLLNEIEQGLMERQDAYCSCIFPQDQRLEMEKKLLDKVAKKPLAQALNLEGDLKDIFKKDWHCAELGNKDRRKNGSLMWVYLNSWKLHVKQQKQKRAEQSLGTTPQSPAGSRTRT